MSLSRSFVSTGANLAGRCILCNEVLPVVGEKRKEGIITSERSTLEKYADQWQALDTRVCDTFPYSEFRNASDRLNMSSSEQEKFTVHSTCSVTLRNRIKRKQSQQSSLPPLLEDDTQGPVEDIMSPTTSRTKRSRSKSKSTERICFVCNKRSEDGLSYNDGGIGRCSEESSQKGLKESRDKWLSDLDSEYNAAAQRLNILLIGCGDDAFAADIYYHKQCYNHFTAILRQGARFSSNNEPSQIDDQVVSLFLRKVETKIVKDKNAYLLNELCDDCKEISAEFGLDDSPACLRYTYRIKETINGYFGDEIQFSKVGKFVAVHPCDINPLTYSVATLKGHGLREDSIIKCFANLVRRKLKAEEEVIEGTYVPPTSDEFLAEMDKFKPQRCIFNAVSLSINPRRSMEEDGYVKAPKSAQAEKIAAIAESWERLLTNKRTPTATAMSLTLHRITGSKEATKLLHHCGMGVSYTDVRLLTNTWAKEISLDHKKMLPKGFVKKKTIHVTFDNSDGKQQTLLGDNTTHHTTGTIFQSANVEQNLAAETENTDTEDMTSKTSDHDQEKEGKMDFGTFKIPPIRNRAEPPTFPDFSDKYKDSSLLELALQRDIAWVLISSIGSQIFDEMNPSSKDILDPVGSWTAFMKDTSAVKTQKCKLEYLPVVPLPPSDNVVKWYIDMIIQMAEDLEIDYVFVHADEAINSKMLMIMWHYKNKYEKLIPLIGGFHTLLVFLKILHKKYGCLGLQIWWVAADAIKEGSVNQAIEGRHYYRGIALHKQSFNALLRCKINKHLPNDESMKQMISRLRYQTNSGNLSALLNLDSFKTYCSDLLTSNNGTQSQMMIQYVKDVSVLLALVTSVREKSIELHVAAERALLPKCFAFNHINYARYLTVQHINFERMQIDKRAAWDDLLKDGFGGSLTGQSFSTIHGDLITETTINREVKVRGGPMRGGYSTSEKANDTFIKTSHLMAKIRAKLKTKLDVLTSAVHKEIIPASRKRHDTIVTRLTRTLEDYFYPFLDGPARHFSTGAEIDNTVIAGLLTSDALGEACFTKFVKERIMRSGATRVRFFDTITKTKIKTGMEKEKKEDKKMDILKEDRQAFGLLVGKVSTPEEALAYPLTTVPLALADVDKTLRSQTTKSLLRNHIISTANAGKVNLVKDCLTDWFIDGMLAVNSVECKETWKDFADAVLSYCIPKQKVCIKRLSIIFDPYGESSIKQMTQRKRGFSNKRVYITNMLQTMPQGKEWNSFLGNPENKSNLIEVMVERYCSPDIRSKLQFELVVTHEHKTWLITNDVVNELLPCNHIEADTRLILEASKSGNDVVIRSADTDVLMLMCYAHQERDIQKEWTMMIDKETFVSIKEIRTYFGDEICSILPAYHSITGCDTTSYPANVGKIKPFKKMVNTDSIHLLYDLGKSENSYRDLSDSLKFYQMVMYSGKLNETVTDTRVRSFQAQKTKSSINLISDKASIIQHLLRADLQTLIWRLCMEQNITIPSLEGRGWKASEGSILPVWFEGNQLPPSLSRSKKKDTNIKKRQRQATNVRTSSKNADCEPLQKKSMVDEASTSHYEYSSSSSPESTSSVWEAWEDEDFDSSSSSDDPDW